MLAYPAYWLRVLAWRVGALRRRLRRPPAHVVFVLDGDLPELPDPQPPWWQRRLVSGSLSLWELRARFRAVAADDRVRGVVLQLRFADLPAARRETLAEDLRRLRARGKRVIAWAPSYSQAAYEVGCACDEIHILPGGTVGVLGVRARYLYAAQALERVGLRAEVVRVSPFKTAGDVLADRDMSAAAREMAEWLAGSAHDALLAAIAWGRGLQREGAAAIVDAGLLTDSEAVSAHAVDGVATEEELAKALGGGLASYDRARRALPRPRPQSPGRHVAVLRVEGGIVDGHSSRPPITPPVRLPLLAAVRAGDLTVVRDVRAVAGDRRAAAAVLFVDSPGGSSTASEAIASALRELAARKPVVVAMGDLAASGGYYIATPSRWITARQRTLTGSIGVIGLKMVTSGLLDLLGITRVDVERGAAAGLLTDARPYSAGERAKVQRVIDRAYGLFLERVATGRSMPNERVEELAGGRVYTGAQAAGNGLVDAIGGVEDAIAKARELAGLPDSAGVRFASPAKGWLPPAAPSLAAHLLGGVGAVSGTATWFISSLLPEA